MKEHKVKNKKQGFFFVFLCALCGKKHDKILHTPLQFCR